MGNVVTHLEYRSSGGAFSGWEVARRPLSLELPQTATPPIKAVAVSATGRRL
jgi:hypothetical protein